MLPITLTQTQHLQAVVVGGGPVAERKSGALLAAGLKVRVIAPAVTARLSNWHKLGTIEWLPRPYQPGDLNNAQVVLAATNVRTVNAEVAAEAQRLGLLINVADQPAEGNFHMPAVYQDEQCLIAINTKSAQPCLSLSIRNFIQKMMPLFDKEQ